MKLLDLKIIFLLFAFLLTNLTFGSDRGIIKSIPTGQFPGGLTWDGAHLWLGYTGNTQLKTIDMIDTSDGSVIRSISEPRPEAAAEIRGLAWDGSYLWVYRERFGWSTPDRWDYIYKMDTLGVVLDSIRSPFEDYCGGIDYENGHLWLSQYANSTPEGILIKMDTLGTLLDTIVTVGEQPMGVAFDSQYIWCAEDTGFGATRKEIYQYDPVSSNYTGTFIVNPDNAPKDLAWDGQYLWLVGYYTQLVYKISTIGGTPNINLSATSLDFGLVSIGDTAYQYLTIQNIGDDTLEITNMDIDTSVFLIDGNILPLQILSGGSYVLEVSFVPIDGGVVAGTMTVYSNDPLHPAVDVGLTGQGQYVNPTIWLSATFHNFGNVWVSAEGKAKWILNIANTGNQNLEIVDLILNEPEFSVGGFSGFPINLTPGDTFGLAIYFQPNSAQTYEDSLIIASTDPVNPFVYVRLLGTGVLNSYNSGYIFWSYQVPFNPGAGSYQEYEVDGLKTINDINGDGRNEVVIATENYWLLCLDGNSSGFADTLWSFSSYISNSSAGSIGANSDYGVQDAIQVANDLNGDSYNDVVIATGGGNEHVYAIDGTNGEIIWQYGTDDPNSYGLGDFEAVDVQRDFNGDNVEDVLAIADGNQSGTGYKKAFLFNGTNGDIIWDYTYPGPSLSFGKSVISIEDVTADGIPDAIIAVGNNGSTDLKTYCLNGVTGFPIWERESLNHEPKELLELSIPGETPDVIVGEYFNIVRRLDGETGIPVWTRTFGGSLIGIIQMSLISDVNNDGIDDILVASFGAGATCLNGADGTYIWTYPMAFQFGISMVPDLDEDGVDEVIVGSGTSTQPFTGVFYCITGQGDSLFFSQTFNNDKVYTVNVLPSIDGNASYELLAGTRNGKVVCYSGGLNAVSTVQSNSEFLVHNYILNQNYPNPFNPSTRLKFSLPQKGEVSLRVFNILGQEVVKLLDKETFSAGNHEVLFDGQNLSSGIYIYRLESKFGVLTRKMMLMK